MVNLERVKHQCQIAFYEQKEEKHNRGIGQYYRSDFIGKEIIKSIFTGTIAYGVMAVLWVMANMEAVLDSVNDLSIVYTVLVMILIYVGFIIVYLFATYIVYALRYIKGKKKLEQYKEHLKALNQMYEREEKLKL
ncbi:MAG: hypothetical protein IJO60_12260 [Agathobacter sp.]|nr:hypothetical protein [Agathobacter sp.]